MLFLFCACSFSALRSVDLRRTESRGHTWDMHSLQNIEILRQHLVQRAQEAGEPGEDVVLKICRITMYVNISRESMPRTDVYCIGS